MPPITISLNPAASESSASLALSTPMAITPQPAVSLSAASMAMTAPTTIPLNPAASHSAASLALTTGATPSAYVGSALTVQPYTAAELHPHTFPPSLFDAAPMIVTTVYVVVRESFRFHRALHDERPDRPR
jgi:hypothetical protein